MDENKAPFRSAGLRRDLGDQVGAKEERKLRARGRSDRVVWFGLGMFGVVGWSVAIPTLLGAALGIWLDRKFPNGRHYWTLAMLLAGVALGCFNAWYWVDRENRSMLKEEEGDRRKS